MAKMIIYLALCICCGAMGPMVPSLQIAAATVIHSETDKICGDSRFVDDLLIVSVQIGQDPSLKKRFTIIK